MLCKASELKKREVINVCDGKRLGNITDFEIMVPEGRIEAIVVPGTLSLGSFFKSSPPIVIPWSNIRKIGEDVIIVELPKNYYRRLEEN